MYVPIQHALESQRNHIFPQEIQSYLLTHLVIESPCPIKPSSEMKEMMQVEKMDIVVKHVGVEVNGFLDGY